jgi:hypothetical protein
VSGNNYSIFETLAWKTPKFPGRVVPKAPNAPENERHAAGGDLQDVAQALAVAVAAALAVDLWRVWSFRHEFRELEWKTPLFFWRAVPKTPNASHDAFGDTSTICINPDRH